VVGTRGARFDVRISGIERTGVSGPLRQYRLYFLNAAGKIETAPYEFEAPDDQAAGRVAEAWREGRTIELWNGERKVRCWGFSNSANARCN
jgi:hypothetical protein